MRRRAAAGSRGLNRKQSYGLGLLPSARRHAWSRTPSSYSAHSDQRYVLFVAPKPLEQLSDRH